MPTRFYMFFSNTSLSVKWQPIVGGLPEKFLEFYKELSCRHHIITIFRNSRPKVFCKKDVFRNFAKFNGKTTVPESLFLHIQKEYILFRLVKVNLQFVQAGKLHDRRFPENCLSFCNQIFSRSLFALKNQVT